MCFNYDYCDYVARVSQTDLLTCDAPTRCCECRRTLPAGARFEYVFQQENDENDWAGDEGEFDPGHRYEAWTCADCLLVRAAVIASELEEGCGRHEACPAYEVLFDEIRDGDRARYAKKIVEMHGKSLSPEYLELALGEDYRELLRDEPRDSREGE